MKKILMVSDYFYPDITPRAFRSFELAKELSQRGYEVEVLTKYYDCDYNKKLKDYNIKVEFYNDDCSEEKYIESHTENNNSYILNLKNKLSYFYDGRSAKNKINMISSKIINSNKKYKGIISIGLPFFIHQGVAKARSMNKDIAQVTIADYGDPYSRNPEFKKAFYYVIKEKIIMNNFDKITIPVEKSRPYYKFIKNNEDIHIIPQGFDIESINIAKYRKNNVPTFAYAGVFYSKIRNPQWFLEYISKLEENFKFIIYTDLRNIENMNCINPYINALGGKLELRDKIPREECIFNLSKMDFLINFDNKKSNQVPSKIIDYSISKRPILSLSSEEDIRKFNNFLNNDYSELSNVDIEEYNIKNVSNKFIKLIENK